MWLAITAAPPGIGALASRAPNPGRRGAALSPRAKKASSRPSSSSSGANPFASSDLMALRGKLPSKPELATGVERAGSDGEMTRMSEADVVAAFSGKGGAMKASRSERKKNAPSGTTTAKKQKPSATMGSGAGASAGAPAATQEVRVGVTRAGKKGKTVTVVDGFDPGGPDAAADVLKKFKRVLGAGGSLASNGAMSFQGDRAATLVEMLHAMGYKRAKQTGGLGNK